MVKFDPTQKAAIYQALAQLSSSFTTILTSFETFRKAGIITPKYKRLFQGFTLELQAEINAEILNPLHDAELADWTRHGRVRQKWEQYLRGKNSKHKPH